MKHFIMVVLAVTGLLGCSGCASIFSKSNYLVNIHSSPSDASITITDVKGTVVYKGNTPATVSLAAGAGFFKRASYQLKFNKEGYDERIIPIHFKLDGWYIANLISPYNLLGFLVIDPLSGAMYKIEQEFINEILRKSDDSASVQNNMQIYSIDEIPEHWKPHLVELAN